MSQRQRGGDEALSPCIGACAVTTILVKRLHSASYFGVPVTVQHSIT